MKKIELNDRKILIIMLGLMILLFAHNFYLQIKVTEATDFAADAYWEASRAKVNAREASNYAEAASDYARDASSYAKDASYYAENAYYNAFGFVCSHCPSTY